MQYAEANVKYVEYSVGIADLLKPWVWPYLVNRSNDAVGVEYRFFAMLPRGMVQFDPSSVGLPAEADKTKWPTIDSMRKDVKVNMQTLKRLIRNCTDKVFRGSNLSFAIHLRRLTQLEELLKQRPRLAEKYIVGLDLAGDENLAPFSPFTQPQFITFLKSHSGRGFGCRVHCGELTVDPAEEELKVLQAHMKIMIEDMAALVQARIPLRIGHGVALVECMQRLNLIKRLNLFPGLETLIDKKIPIEINPTSNYQLLANPSGRSKDKNVDWHAAKILKEPFPIIICTDDDGIIFPIAYELAHQGPTLHSVAAEYALAYKKGLIEEKDLEKMAKSCRKHCFVNLTAI